MSEFVNEYCIWLFAYCMLLFTGITALTPVEEYDYGRSASLLIVMVIYCINLALVLLMSLRKARLRLVGCLVKRWPSFRKSS